MLQSRNGWLLTFAVTKQSIEIYSKHRIEFEGFSTVALLYQQNENYPSHYYFFNE